MHASYGRLAPVKSKHRIAAFGVLAGLLLGTGAALYVLHAAADDESFAVGGDRKDDGHPTADAGRLMLTVLRQGQLGNAMWEYSSMYGLAKLTNRTAVLPPSFRDLGQIFRLSAPVLRKERVLEGFQVCAEEDFELPVDVRKIASHLSTTNKSVILKGYLQHHRYFRHVADEIRKEFTFREHIRRQVDDFFDEHGLADSQLVRVGLHFRRTELRTRHWIELGYGPPELTYYGHAMDYFRRSFPNVRFVVCSDDIGWVRQHVVGDDVTFVEGRGAEVDLAILASCDHVIVGNGTFSWWAGWLCAGITVRNKDIPANGTWLHTKTSGEYWPPDDHNNHYVSIE